MDKCPGKCGLDIGWLLTLSVSIWAITSSSLMVSPVFLRTAAMVPSETDSPICGTLTSKEAREKGEDWIERHCRDLRGEGDVHEPCMCPSHSI